MAVEGRKLSDIINNREKDACIPCARDGRKVAAIKYCVECDENLCLTCLSHHNRFPVMREHQTSDTLSTQTRQKTQELPKQTCGKHGGKLVDLYCSKHDFVGCSDCMEEDHISCQGIQYISGMVKRIQLGNEISELNTKLNDQLTRLDQYKQRKQACLNDLQQEKGRLLNEIRVLRIKINKQLDKMEKILTDEVESRSKMKIELTNKAIDTINNMKSSAEKHQKNIQDAQGINKAEMFVQLKKGNLTLQEHEQTIKLIDSGDSTRSMKLLPSKDIQRLLENDDISLGRLSENLVAKSIEHAGDINVRLQSDEKTCLITDLCLTSCRSVVIIDQNNKSIKKLDSSYTVIEHLEMPDKPAGLCLVDRTQLAVTLVDLKKVRFLSQEPLKLGKSFSVGDHCRGIGCHNEEIFVCCGGKILKGEGPGHIEVYDMNGVLLRSFHEGHIWPLYIKIFDKNTMFISNNVKNNVLSCSTSSNTVSEMQIMKLSEPTGLCRVGDDQLCIAGWKSNNIVMTTQDGKQQIELLTAKDGIVRPWALCFDEKQSHMLVSLEESGFIKVFNISF